MQVSFISPEIQLSPYIDLIWTFKSSFGLPMADSRLIVPDGRAKIIIPYKNDVHAIAGGKILNAAQHQILLIGIQTNPVTIASTTATTSTIGVELTPHGLYHFFNLRMHELTNRMFSFEAIFGSWGHSLQQRIGDAAEPQVKIALLQNALAGLLTRNTKDYSLLDYTLNLIKQSHGMITVQALEAQTGYTKRYLDILFKDHVGLSPKSYANILRFQEAYQLWTQGGASISSEDNPQAYYYDQSHFIKEFKRFTGFTPHKYNAVANEFGKVFSKS